MDKRLFWLTFICISSPYCVCCVCGCFLSSILHTVTGLWNVKNCSMHGDSLSCQTSLGLPRARRGRKTERGRDRKKRFMQRSMQQVNRLAERWEADGTTDAGKKKLQQQPAQSINTAGVCSLSSSAAVGLYLAFIASIVLITLNLSFSTEPEVILCLFISLCFIHFCTTT